MAEFEGHTHYGHACDNKQKGNHEVIWVFRHNVTKANGGQGDEGEIKGIKIVQSLPASQNLTEDHHICKYHQQDDQQRDFKAVHLLSDANE